MSKPEGMSDEEIRKHHEHLARIFGSNPIPQSAPRNDSNPIDRLNHSLEDAGLGCFVSDTRHV